MRTLPAVFKQVNDLNEIIFANRNKQYGAYELRKHYNDRLLKAFLITTSSLLMLLFVSLIVCNNSAPIITKPIWGDPPPIPPPDFEAPKIPKTIPPAEPRRANPAPPVIINDTASQHIEKQDSTKTISSQGTSSPNGETTSHGENSTGKGTTVNTFSKGENADSIHKFATVMPSFPGGDKAFSKYIQRNFNTGGSNTSEEISEGKIIIRFVVMKDGSIANVEVLRNTLGAAYSNEAMNVLLNCPKWNPGIQNNQPVNVQLVLPITVER